MATIKDIAKVAKVSQATVSNVLNGKDNVSSDKIRRVMKAVEDMGYVINEKAQNLRKGTAKILAVVVPNLYDKTYIDFFSSFKDYAERKEYTVDLYITNDDDDYERKQIQKIKSSMTEGVAVFTSISDGSEAYYEAGFSNEDVVAPAKIINDFTKEADALEIKGGAIEGAVASKEEIVALATLPNREGLLSMLLSVLQAPVRNVALAVKAVADNKEEAA